MSTEPRAQDARLMGAQLKRDIAEVVALELRLNAADCAQIAAGLTAMGGDKWGGLIERTNQWAAAMLKGEREIRRMLAAGQPNGQE